ncbi:MAG: hypothetical protein U0361_15470 [Nitrospiraceae bacterium]
MLDLYRQLGLLSRTTIFATSLSAVGEEGQFSSGGDLLLRLPLCQSFPGFSFRRQDRSPAMRFVSRFRSWIPERL